MPPQIATLIFAVGILGLFRLDRDRETRTSKAHWIAVAWVFIAASRPVSLWLQNAPPPSSKVGSDANQIVEGSPLDRNVFAALLVIGLIVLIGRRRRVAELLRNNGAILLFFAYAAVSAFWSDFPDVSFKRWTKSLGDLTMVLLVLTEVHPSAAVRRLLTRIGFLLVPLSILFIKYIPELGRVYSPWTWTWSAVGVTGNKNELGMLCLVVGLGAVWRLLLWYKTPKGARRKGPMRAQVALLAMVCYLLTQAHSTTSTTCLMMGSFLMAATYHRTLVRNSAAVHGVVAAVISLPVFALFLDPGGSLLQGLGKDPTLTGRTDIWRGLIGMAAHPLIGAGFESFWLGSRLESSHSLMWRLNEAHNGYLEVWLNLGWIGAILLALVIATGYRNVVRTLRRNPDLGRIMLAYFTVGVIYSLTEAGFRMLSVSWIFFLLAINAVSRSDISQTEPTFGVQPAERFLESEARVAYAPSVGFGEEIN